MAYEQQPEGGEPRDEPRPERAPRTRPRVYVASLADYNAGRLHGTWIDADQDVERLQEAIDAMLRAAPEPGAEEWAIHDYEGFAPLRLSEHEALEDVAALASAISEHGPAFAHWAALRGASDPQLLEGFAEAYLGHWESVESYAESLLGDLGYDELLEQAIPEHLRPYVRLDVEGFARDLELGGDVVGSPGDVGVYLFDGRA